MSAHQWQSWANRAPDYADCSACGVVRTRVNADAQCRVALPPNFRDIAQAAGIALKEAGYRPVTHVLVQGPRFPEPITFETALAVHFMEQARSAFIRECDRPKTAASPPELPPLQTVKELP